jgi:hypothetical protein
MMHSPRKQPFSIDDRAQSTIRKKTKTSFKSPKANRIPKEMLESLEDSVGQVPENPTQAYLPKLNLESIKTKN